MVTKARSQRRSNMPVAPLSQSDSRPGQPFRASKRLGQNFLRDKGTILRIVQALNPKPHETIIEIGPGMGALTGELLERAGRLVAVEFDEVLVLALRDRFGANENFNLLQGDALDTDFCAAIRPAKSARVVANLPYNISTAILQRLIEQRRCLTEMVLMLQREVVDRITAAAGSSDRGYLSVLVEAYCQMEKLFDVAPGSFKPAPKVWSSVICLTLRPRIAAEVGSEEFLWDVVKAGFAQRRKTILNNLRNTTGNLQEQIKRHGGASIVLCRAAVDLRRRAETLTLAEWAGIARALD